MKVSQSTVLAVFLLSPCSLILGQSAPPADKVAPPADTKPGDAQGSGKDTKEDPPPVKPILESRSFQRQPQPGYGHHAMVDRRLAAFVRLRELMFEAVKLDAEKRKKIDTMFDDYMAGLMNPNQRPHFQPRPEDAATPQEIPELKKQLEEAEKGDDKDKVALLQARIYAARIALEPSVIDEPVFFFNYVKAELTEEERKAFEPVLTRWRMLRVAEVAPDNDYKQLRRSTRDPLLRDTEELGKQLDELIVQGYRSIPLGPQRLDISVMAELAVTTKPKILEKLNPQQREHFEKTLDMLKRWDKEDPEIARKTRERLKDHPAVTAERNSAPPAQGSGNQP